MRTVTAIAAVLLSSPALAQQVYAPAPIYAPSTTETYAPNMNNGNTYIYAPSYQNQQAYVAPPAYCCVAPPPVYPLYAPVYRGYGGGGGWRHHR
jgi:hypothetical protein